jgi:phosphate butyryltransferase
MELLILDEFFQTAQTKKSKRIVIAAAQDPHVLKAIQKAYQERIIEPVLIGDSDQIQRISESISFNLEKVVVIHDPDPVSSCRTAVDIIREGKADILMKGMVSSAPLLKAILDKKNGLRKRDLLSHFAFMEIPGYHKLLGITDAAMSIKPSLKDKISIILNAVEVFHRLGKRNPKVAVLGPIEKVNERIESTVHAREIMKLNQQGKIKGCIVDGPLALDIAVSKEAAEHKKIKGDVAGDADLLVTPDLNSGNILYKSMTFLGGATSASVIMGASVPVVLTSRADSDQSKLMSIALAAALE